ncbi:hypothetical protein BK403_28005 [Escherichia coli]|uniref:hypothetical protein n=2 Tax=Enterobacteriaceae TaxID=543 RepID=UPI000925FE09|nr:hypothetical protein [Escherichia coli]OJS17830.1 hypothetical protein BK396_26875 [Escherichia coli]OJS19184.1 hypothetical protein BK397_24070 [Escherichia coli]OJS43159.1 hypothetical protein BK403_28005 [Escherichia coli]
MKTRIIRSLTAMALLAPIALAQTGTTKPAEPAKTPTPAAPAQTAPAATTTSASPQVPVTGLTAENSEKVTKALKDYTNAVYKCASCSEVSYEAGQCCGKEKTSQTGAAFATVKADPTASTISFTVAPTHEIKLSEIERILTSNGVKVSRDKLSYGPSSQIVIANVADQAAADVIKKALVDAKVFEQIDIKVPAGHKEAHITVVKAGSSAATEARVKETLAKANPTASVTDVAWTAPASKS